MDSCRPISLVQPPVIAFGTGCIDEVPDWIEQRGFERVFLVCDPMLGDRASRVTAGLTVTSEIFSDVKHEPDTDNLEAVLARARGFEPDLIVGLGGGSTMDLAKLTSVLVGRNRNFHELLATGEVGKRTTGLVQIATTAGTGSEVGPRAVMTDSRTNQKQAIGDLEMIADLAVVDPELTMTVSPAVTASTGVDALSHCLEAYTNRLAHPAIDLYALEGIRLVVASLAAAVADSGDREARLAMSLASMYGGFCLGPVNTAAAHALAYPLGTRYHIAHGISNALVLPYVVEFNLPACRDRMARAAAAMGATGDPHTLADRASERIRELCERVGIELRLSRLGIPESDLEGMADEAVGIQRLLKNNPREVTRDDILGIYRAAY